MSSVAFDIAARLATLSFGTVGTDIFVESLPDSELSGGFVADNIIGVFALPSGEPTEETMGDSVAFELYNLQVQVRNNSLQTAESKSYSIFNLVPTVGVELTINTTGYNRIWRMGTPRQMLQADAQGMTAGEDSKGRVKWVIEFGVKRRPEGVVA